MATSCSEEPISSLSNPPQNKKTKKSNLYLLRECSTRKRKDTERKKKEPKKRGPKPRPRSVPMSKYRRKTANMRERARMGEINLAFENLRQRLPGPVESGKTKCEKLTKINILHVAINYIWAMESLLKTGESHVTSFSEMTKNPLRDENDSKIEMQRILSVLKNKGDGQKSPESDTVVESSFGKVRKSVKKGQKCDKTFDNVKTSQLLPLNDWNSPVNSPSMQTESPITTTPDSIDPRISSISPDSGYNLPIDDITADSFFNIDHLHVCGQATDEAMKDLYSEFVEMIGTLPEIVLEDDNLDMFS